MANLKADLLNELRTQKYYAEMELLRLAQDPSMKYRNKIEDIDFQLGEIALINSKIGLAEGYFQDAPQQEAVPNVPEAPQEEVAEMPAPAPAPAPTPHQGQSHAE
jgi:hypothetical protein